MIRKCVTLLLLFTFICTGCASANVNLSHIVHMHNRVFFSENDNYIIYTYSYTKHFLCIGVRHYVVAKYDKSAKQKTILYDTNAMISGLIIDEEYAYIRTTNINNVPDVRRISINGSNAETVIKRDAFKYDGCGLIACSNKFLYFLNWEHNNRAPSTWSICKMNLQTKDVSIVYRGKEAPMICTSDDQSAFIYKNDDNNQWTIISVQDGVSSQFEVDAAYDVVCWGSTKILVFDDTIGYQIYDTQSKEYSCLKVDTEENKDYRFCFVDDVLYNVVVDPYNRQTQYYKWDYPYSQPESVFDLNINVHSLFVLNSTMIIETDNSTILEDINNSKCEYCLLAFDQSTHNWNVFDVIEK